MSKVKANFFANISGNVWSALMGVIFIPFYIHLMGVESYALVGVFFSLQALFTVLDLGLSQTLAREVARLSVVSDGEQQIVNTARTLEVIYWLTAVLVFAIILASSNFIAYQWLKPQQLQPEAVRQALWLIALVVGFRWPLTLYIGGLNGLQKQVQLNALLAIFSTFQGAGALFFLWMVAPTIKVFFLWQASLALVQVIVLRYAMWRALPRLQARVSFGILKGVLGFALNMSGIALLAAILTQLDKVILSKMLSLDDFGFYVFASTVAGVLSRFVSPVFTAYLPRFTQLISAGNKEEAKNLYHQGSQLMALVLVPATFVVFFFSKDILFVWTENENLVRHSYALVSMLILGNVLNGLLGMPYAIQLAYGWTRLTLYQNFLCVLFAVPALFFGITLWGGMGAAYVWVLLNGAILIFSIPIMHKKIFSGEMRRWYSQSLIFPLVVACGVSAFLAYVVVMPTNRVLGGLCIAGVSAVVFSSVCFSLPLVRGIVLKRLGW